MTLASNLRDIRARVARACSRSRRDPSCVTIIAAVKGISPYTMSEALDAGITSFGENRVQETALHQAALGRGAANADWHMIGHLQTNKVASALSLFAMIHTVDSLRLAKKLSRQAGWKVPVLLEVNVADDPSKYGFHLREIESAVREVGELANLELRGFMTVAPAVAQAEEARPAFRALSDIARSHSLGEVSMGMSDDFEVAVEEGATMIRLGRAIFSDGRP